MVRLAIQDNPHFVVSDIELRRGGTSYTVDTMEFLKVQYPEDELYFIMGMDSLLDLNSWKDVDRLAKLCPTGSGPPVRVMRFHPKQRSSLRLPPIVWRQMHLLEVPGLDIAATELRDRVRRGQSVRYLLVSEVEEYIRDNGLYV